jgi:hypothetical protein
MTLPLWSEISEFPRAVRAGARSELITAAVCAFFPQLVLACAFIISGVYTYYKFAETLDHLFHNGEMYMISVALVAPLAYGIGFRKDLPQRHVFLIALGVIVVVATVAVLLQFYGHISQPWIFHVVSIIVATLTFVVLYCEFAFEQSVDPMAAARQSSQDAKAFAKEFAMGKK